MLFWSEINILLQAHFGEGSNFDFQKFIKRALEEDFGVVVGTR